MSNESATTESRMWASPSQVMWRAVCTALGACAAALAAFGIVGNAALSAWVARGWALAALAALPLACFLVLAVAFTLGRRQAERRAAFFESQARRNRMLLRTASDGLHVLDRSGHLVKFSDSFAAALGRSREELRGAHVASWDAHYAPAVMADWFQSFQPGEQRAFESLHRRADGSLIDVEVSCSMVRIDGHDLIYCSARDVTRRKKLELQLAESAAQARSLYDGAPCGYHSLDAQGRYVYVNDTELGWLGCGRDELVGRCGPQEFLTKEGIEVFARNFPRLLDGQSVDGVEVDVIGRDGRERRVSVSSTPMLDDQGRFRMSRTVMYDMTDLHRTRQHLHQVLREQEAMLDNDLIGMVRLRDRRVLWTNQAMCHLFDYEPQELVGASTSILYADPDRFETIGREAYAQLEGGGRYHEECELVRKGGEPLWVEINGVMLSRESGESMWLFADITPRKRAFDQVAFLAFHDPLTGLPNRTLLTDRLQHELHAAQRSGELVAVCYVDLDGFKALNDRLGHAAGDALLREVARRLCACTRSVDTVGRLGGDEFVVVLSRLEDMQTCLDILHRVDAVMHAAVALEDFGSVQLLASIGVALFPQDGTTPADLLAHADAAMYEAKRGSGGSMRFHESGGRRGNALDDVAD